MNNRLELIVDDILMKSCPRPCAENQFSLSSSSSFSVLGRMSRTTTRTNLKAASRSLISPSLPSDGGEGWGEEARPYWVPLSSVLSPLVPRGERMQSLMQPRTNPASAIAVHAPRQTLRQFLLSVVIMGAAVLANSTLSSAPAKVACIGDSITEGSGLANPATESYPAKLQRLLGDAYQVRNFGVSGRTLLKKGDFPYWNEAAYRESRNWNPDIVIIKLGTNDSKPQNWRYSTNFVADFEALIGSYTNLTSHPRVLLCTPCPVYGNGAFDIRPGVVATNIAASVRELASQLGLELIDLHSGMAGHREWFPDTVHPNTRGTTVLAALVRTALVRGHPNTPLPPLAIGSAIPNRVVLNWPSAWAGLVLQSTTAAGGTNTVWTIVEQVAFNDGSQVRVTNTLSGLAKVYRLWLP